MREDKDAALEHMAELQAQSAALTERIQAAQASAAAPSSSSPSRTPSAAGFIWPVHGVVTSGFGWRWGRMHEGIDIAVGSGTPIVAPRPGP